MSRDAQLVQAWGGPCTCQGESPSSCAMFWLWLLETQAVECVWLLQTTDSIKTRNVFHTVHHSEYICSFALTSRKGGSGIKLEMYYTKNGLAFTKALHWILNVFMAATKQGLGMPLASSPVHTSQPSQKALCKAQAIPSVHGEQSWTAVSCVVPLGLKAKRQILSHLI